VERALHVGALHQILPPRDLRPYLIRAVEQGMEAEGSFVAINNRVSQSVPHLHVHIVPRRKKDGLRGFFWPRQKYKDAEEMERIRKSIQETVERLQSGR
jgi:histidine triad (HIT) family protein